MKAARRFVNDESGMTMALTVILIVLIGVMGAGLLTFVSKDLNTVVEENRGQRAFEVADAGIEAAERQLESDCIGDDTCMVFYDDNVGDAGGNDIQWSVGKGGVTLNDLDEDLATSDSVTVTIDYIEVLGEGNDNYYKAISTGTFGSSKRKIEAIFKPIAGGGGGGGNVINPAYYTPSDILVTSRNRETGLDEGTGVRLTALSLFSGKNIIFEGLTSSTFIDDYESTLRPIDRIRPIGGPAAQGLKDWDSTTFNPSGSWNTIGRDNARNGQPFTDPGFAAEGLICGSTTNCDDPSDSIADGWYGYDSTTGDFGPDGVTPNPLPRGQGLTFIDKQPEDVACGTGPDCYGPNADGTISYPFERREPDAARLKRLAINTNGFYRGSDPPWDTLLSGDRSRVVFIDAGDAPEQPVTFDGGGGTAKGIIVVWCGTLEMTNFNNSGFQGIVMALNGDAAEDQLPPDPETGAVSSSCGAEQGKFSIDHAGMRAWFYAEGGDVSSPGITLGPGTQADFLPSGRWRLLDLLLEDVTPTRFDSQGWRECYQLNPATECGT